MVVFLLIAFCQAISCPIPSLINRLDTFPPEPKEEEIFRVVPRPLPKLLGCRDLDQKEAVITCNSEQLAILLQPHLQYPKRALEANMEGVCTVQFKILDNYQIHEIELLYDIGYGCGEAVIQALHSLNAKKVYWGVGNARGRSPNMKFRLPIRFKLLK